jgi:hypothetical protein
MKNLFKKIGGFLVVTVIFLSTLYGLFFLFDKKEAKKIALQKETVDKFHEYLDFGKDFEKHKTFLRAPGSVLRVKLSKGARVIYDQIYKTDENLFRVPVPQNNEAKSHLIFAGCSFTWGEGLKDEMTLPYVFAAKDKEFQSYNLGFPGGGLHTLLHYTSMFHLKDVIKEKNGYMVFSVILPQFDRFFGRYNYLSWADPEYVHYAVENDKVVFKGELRDQGFYQSFKKAQSAGVGNTMINLQDPLKWSDSELHDFAVASGELSKRYKRELPRGKFVMMIHPAYGSGMDKEIKARIIKALRDQKIEVWDPSDDFLKWLTDSKIPKDELYIKDDGHPTAKTNDYLAEWIDQKIKTAN